LRRFVRGSGVIPGKTSNVGKYSSTSSKAKTAKSIPTSSGSRNIGDLADANIKDLDKLPKNKIKELG
jgi:hypothetical protein